MAAVDLEEMLTPSQAARRLEVSSQSIANWLASGRLACVQTPLGRLISPADVDELAAQRQMERAARR